MVHRYDTRRPAGTVPAGGAAGPAPQRPFMVHLADRLRVSIDERLALDSEPDQLVISISQGDVVEARGSQLTFGVDRFRRASVRHQPRVS